MIKAIRDFFKPLEVGRLDEDGYFQEVERIREALLPDGFELHEDIQGQPWIKSFVERICEGIIENDYKYVEQRKKSREEIAKAFGVPASKIGKTKTYYQRIEEARARQWEKIKGWLIKLSNLI
jgi:hypothetical protein